MAYFLKKFQNETEYNEWKTSEEYLEPNVCKILNNRTIQYKPYDPYNGHEYVDLGLPSGIKWAKCNVGANSESETGLYFAWGETKGYTITDFIDDENYKWFVDYDDDGNVIYSKYNSTDGKTVLDLEDDAAHMNMGGDWRMPTKSEFEELIGNTISQLEINNGIQGISFYSENGNTLFIPGSEICIWSSSLKANDNASILRFSTSLGMSISNHLRASLNSIRGVVK